jgi:hypothetical protein
VPSVGGDITEGPEVDLTLARATLDAWVAVWNSFDLDAIESLFVTDSTVTYFSSEREGLIVGWAQLLAHHEGFGFVPGGEVRESRLWLDDLQLHVAGTAVSAAAIWYFQRTPEADSVMRGPVSFVLVPDSAGYRIQHANFGNY